GAFFLTGAFFPAGAAFFLMGAVFFLDAGALLAATFFLAGALFFLDAGAFLAAAFFLAGAVFFLGPAFFLAAAFFGGRVVAWARPRRSQRARSRSSATPTGATRIMPRDKRPPISNSPAPGRVRASWWRVGSIRTTRSAPRTP